VGIELTTDPGVALRDIDLVIDFTAPAVCAALAPLCAEHRVPYLVGSTALRTADEKALDSAARSIPILAAANFSIGVALAIALVESAAKTLGPEFDIEILELHHNKKRDAPSGTALALAGAAKRGRGSLETVLGRGSSTAARRNNELGVAALRGGDMAGEHTVYFLGAGERVEISHRATTPEIFARGALNAAAWLIGQAPGRYDMRDVLAALRDRS